MSTNAVHSKFSEDDTAAIDNGSDTAIILSTSIDLCSKLLCRFLQTRHAPGSLHVLTLWPLRKQFAHNFKAVAKEILSSIDLPLNCEHS